MRNAKFLLAGLLMLGASACGFSESKFEKKALTATCEYTVDCFDSHSDVATCEDASDDAEEVDTSDCEYDSDKAKDCVDALEALTCDDSFPAACADVYDCGSSSNNTSNTSNNTSNDANNMSNSNGGSNNTSGAE